MEILMIDSSINKEFRNSLDLSLLQRSLTPAILTSFQNDIKAYENNIIAFCNAHVGMYDDFFDTYTAIVGQSSNYLKPGSKLEIKAGVGEFSVSAQPKIIIDGVAAVIGEEGYALVSKKVQTKPGTYKVPVSISFFNKVTGTQDTREVDVEYTVAKECDQ